MTPVVIVTRYPSEVCSLSGEASASIRLITRRHSLFRHSSTRTPITLPCGSVSPEGGVYGLTLFLDLRPGGLGSAYLPEEQRLRIGQRGSPIPVLLPFGQAFQRLWLVYNDDIYRQFTLC